MTEAQSDITSDRYYCRCGTDVLSATGSMSYLVQRAGAVRP
jgi:hypothetical protein